MKVYNRKSAEIEFTNLISEKRIRIELENGDFFDLCEEHGRLVITKIEGAIFVNPSLSNVIKIG